MIGLGSMGRPIAERLLAAEHELVIYNRSRQVLSDLSELGAETAFTPADVASRVGYVMTALPGPAAVEEVVLGKEGILDGAHDGLVYADLSTSTPALAKTLYKHLGSRGTSALDAPVSGGVVGAREGSLTVMVGGDASAARSMEPLFASFAANITHVGGAGAGQVAKAGNQIIVGLTIQAVAEALVLARAYGLDPATVLQAWRGGFADSRVLSEHGARMVEEQFAPGAALRLHLKDLHIALDLARELDLSLPATGGLAGTMERLVASGFQDHDHSILLASYQSVSTGRSKEAFSK
jgi:2-hydroxy-3-oxopropionate reductase